MKSRETFGMEETIRLYYYTSRQAAQDIGCSLRLRPGPSGSVKLTTEFCSTGTAAAGRLSIQGSPVEFRCEVEIERHRVRGPLRAQYVLGPDGILQRAGGGAEYEIDEVCFNDPPRFTPLESP